MSSTGGNNTSGGNRNSSGDGDDGSWGSKLVKIAGAAAVAGGLYALLTSSSSSEQQSPFEAPARRVIKEPDDVDGAWSPHHDETPSPQIKWTKPELGWVKLNVDGSRDHIGQPPSAGCGGVLRDASGDWLLGFAQKLNPCYEIHEIEIMAILKGLEVARDMKVKKLVVESDSKSAVSMVENGLGRKYNHPQIDIINHTRELRFDPKWEVKVVHVSTHANRVADRLANDARKLPFEYLRKYPDIPDRCTTLIQADAQAAGVSYYN